MTNQDIVVDLENRTVIRKGLKQLRRDGKVPAVIHDPGKDSLHVTGDFRHLTKVYEQAGKHHPVQLAIDGKQQLAMIKDVDVDPMKYGLRHVVFQAIKQNEKVHATVPLHIVGDIPANKLSLLVLHQLSEVEVSALPKDLPDEITIEGTALENVGDRLTVAELKAPTGVTILTDSEHVIATVEQPKDQIAEADAAAADLAADAVASGGAEADAPAAEGGKATEDGEEE